MKNTTNNLFPIRTERIQLHLVTMKYVEEIFKEFTDEVTKYLRTPTPENLEYEKQWVRKSKLKHKEGIETNFVITDTEGRFIGGCGIMHLDTKTPEVGLWIKQSERGKGYGKEVVGALIQRLKDNKPFDYIVYRVAVENIGSRKVIESLGGKLQLTPEGKETILIEKKGADDGGFEAVEYRIYQNSQNCLTN